MFWYMKKMAFYLLIAIFFVSLDRWLKYYSLMMPPTDIKIWGDYLQFTFSRNFNIAFSLPLPSDIAAIIASVLVLGLMVYAFNEWKKKEYDAVGLLVIIIFGASSNIIDRFQYGYVIDYLDLKYYTIFNLADAMVTLGAIFLLFASLKNGSRKKLISN